MPNVSKKAGVSYLGTAKLHIDSSLKIMLSFRRDTLQNAKCTCFKIPLHTRCFLFFSRRYTPGWSRDIRFLSNAPWPATNINVASFKTL